MAYNITSGNIVQTVLYRVTGEQSVTYNTVTYNTGQEFRGVSGVTTYTFSGSGTQEVLEVPEIRSVSIQTEYVEFAFGAPVVSDRVEVKSISIQMEQNKPDFPDQTQIKSISISIEDVKFMPIILKPIKYWY